MKDGPVNCIRPPIPKRELQRNVQEPITQRKPRMGSPCPPRGALSADPAIRESTDPVLIGLAQRTNIRTACRSALPRQPDPGARHSQGPVIQPMGHSPTFQSSFRAQGCPPDRVRNLLSGVSCAPRRPVALRSPHARQLTRGRRLWQRWGRYARSVASVEGLHQGGPPVLSNCIRGPRVRDLDSRRSCERSRTWSARLVPAAVGRSPPGRGFQRGEGPLASPRNGKFSL
ncbi:hypothetical protein NDU88_001896 [Pleurodeles waltl]|uniref:Uncharacterized protein n=1 Tax=Pleurodeles waltl TaxID=8319 RepID=A0AAV7Q4E3_PLEWA|nr:hypothetical protein NDU88_001896 [Pleurodeles waltl]